MKKITPLDDPRYVKALSHPLRVRILAILEERTASPVQLAEQLDASLGVVSYHVRTLERLGLIKLVRTNPVRGAVEHHYRANPRPTISDEGWAARPPSPSRRSSRRSCSRCRRTPTPPPQPAGSTARTPTSRARSQSSTPRAGAQLAKACEQLLDKIDSIEADAKKRIAKDPHADGIVDAGLVIMLFEAARLAAPEPKRQRTRRPLKTSDH